MASKYQEQQGRGVNVVYGWLRKQIESGFVTLTHNIFLVNYSKIPITYLNILRNFSRILGYFKRFLLDLVYTVGEKKDSTLHRAYGVKLPYLRAVWAGQVLILPLEK